MTAIDLARRDDRQVAADTIALLLRAGVIRFDAISLAAAAKATSIPVPDIESSYRAVTRDGRRLALTSPASEPPTDPLVTFPGNSSAGMSHLTRGDARPLVDLDQPEPRLEERLGRNQREAADGGIERLCSRCRTWLPETPENFFYKRRRTGEFMSPCKPCRRQSDRERDGERAAGTRPPVRRSQNRRQGIDGMRRRCSRCQLWLPETPEFFFHRSRDTGEFMSPCKPCRRELARERQRELSR